VNKNEKSNRNIFSSLPQRHHFYHPNPIQFNAIKAGGKIASFPNIGEKRSYFLWVVLICHGIFKIFIGFMVAYSRVYYR